MKYQKFKDLEIRQKFKQNELSNTVLKFVSTNVLNKKKNVARCIDFSIAKHRNYSKTKIVRRCILTNRSRGSIRPFNVARSKLRELLQFGIIPGYKKAV